MEALFSREHFDCVIHLAFGRQSARLRRSQSEANLTGFPRVLEGTRRSRTGVQLGIGLLEGGKS
jgi:hypothetical protein